MMRKPKMMIMKSTIKRKKKGRVGCQGEERSFREKKRKGPGKKVQNLNFIITIIN